MENFRYLTNERREFLKKYANFDHFVAEGDNGVLLSAPHGVVQTRLGKQKVPEIGSLETAIYLKRHSRCSLIAKTKNNFDDANFDEVSDYKNSIERLIAENKIKYVIDFHGLASRRECDVNLGVHLGRNIETDQKALDYLCDHLTAAGFKVDIDQPFMAGANTIAGSVKRRHKELWTIQIEINCAITNRKENFEKWQKLLSVLMDFIGQIETPEK